MSLPFYNWSKTAANNATADATVNWAEGQSPSSVNDSARAMMASTAAFRDDTSGALLTGGTSTAYTLTSNQIFSSKSAMNGAEIAFTVSATNGASPTLNVDGLGADPITLDGTTAVPTGTLVAGSIYTAMYYNSGNAWRLKDFYQVPFLVPIGGMIDYTGAASPNPAFVIPAGQAISRTTYAAYFALVGTTYGPGDGSTTFNVPNLKGRVVAMLDDTGTIVTSATMSPDGNHLGANGGSQASALLTSNLPAYTPSGSISTVVTTAGAISQGFQTGGSFQAAVANSTGNVSNNNPAVVTATAVSTFTGNAQGGTSTAFTNMQPTIMLNKLLRII